MIKKQILEMIGKYDKFLIAAHVHPEADAIGSQLAMARLLKSMGKSVRIINADKVPANLNFLPGSEQIETDFDFAKDDFRFDAAIILDCPVLDRIGKVAQLIKNKCVINIDHHVSAENFGNINWIDANASSAGEMVYGLYKSSAVKLDDLSALYIYTAIMTDTGSFRFSNTTTQTHRIAAELLEYKIDPTQVYERIYETKSFASLSLLAEVLGNIQRTKNGKFVWIKMTNQMLRKNNLTAEAADDFIEFARQVEGAEVVAFLREQKSGKAVKVSLRSKSGIDVNQIAGYFGGGGHVAASGCVIEKGIKQAEQDLLLRVNKALRGKK